MVLPVPAKVYVDRRDEDRDFFGAGVPTWTTDRVELYLGDKPLD